MEPWLIYLIVGLYGLLTGSFLNVVIYRLPRRIPFGMQRSKCPSCSALITWYQNIPLVSYLFLRGRCANCRTRISLRYPLVEVVTALLFMGLFWHFGLTLDFLIAVVLASALIAVFLIDYDHQIIPDRITIPGMVLGLGVAFAPGGLTIWQAAIGLLVGGGSLYLIALLGDWLFKKESMGGGDIKLAAMLGAFLGWQKVLFIFVASAAIGLVVSIGIMVVSSKFRRERVIPFGPFLALAALVALMFGDRLIDYYVTTFVLVR